MKKHAADIARVTASRYMPPWLPEHGYGEFAGERRLTAEQLGIIQPWAKEGALEGNPADLPPIPQWTSDWHLGTPDLTVRPDAYTLAPDGKDVYYNFVVPIPTTANRFVKGVEFLPGNPRVVHHSFIEIDRTRDARRLAEVRTSPGFYGMETPESVVMPGGQLLGWQPGKVPSFAPPGLAREPRRPYREKISGHDPRPAGPLSHGCSAGRNGRQGSPIRKGGQDVVVIAPSTRRQSECPFR